MNYNLNSGLRQATPRNSAMLDAARSYAGGPVTGGAGSSGPQYWRLITVDGDGEPLDPEDQYLITQYHAASEKGLSAYGYSPGGTGGGGGSGDGGGGLVDLVLSGTGNAFTGASHAEGILTLVRGETFATLAQLSTHTGNTTMHITAAERTAWNGLASSVASLSSTLSSHTGNTAVHVTATERANWNSAFSAMHSHTNKSLLDLINQDLSTTGNPIFASYIQLGSVRLQYDSANNALKAVKYDGTAANLYATGGVSAYGYGSGGIMGGGDNNYLTGVSGSGNGTVTFTRAGLASLTWSASHSHDLSLSTSGTGNVVTGLTVSGLTVSVTKGNISAGGGIMSISGSNSGTGNALTSVTGTSGSTVIGSLGWFVNALSVPSTGNVLTGVSLSNGTLSFTKGTMPTGGGAIGTVYQYVNTSLNGTWTSGVVLRTGYISLTGTIAAGSSADASIIYALTSSNMIGLTGTIQRSQWFATPLHLAWRWNGGGVQFTVYNPGTAAVTGSTVTISWIAVCSA